MPKHASVNHARVVDTLAAYWTLVAAWFRILFRRGAANDRHALIAWPTTDPDFGADLGFVDTLQIMNADPVMRDEVRA